MTLTVTDLFCGAGGSSTGAIAVPGVTVRIASNHWDLAVETHNTNHPDADHLCADLSGVDPRRLPRTDLLWASPECTNHSVAKGRKRVDAQPDLFGEVLPDAAAERSRATMWDVPRFAETHRYQAVIVENVVDAWHWQPFRAWLMAMDSLGYGRYRQQYIYTCPTLGCHQIVEPHYRPAAEIIDWTLLGQRIGDRTKPLAEKTLARIRAGIERYWAPLLVEAAGNTYDAANPKHPGHGRSDGYYRAWPLGDPMRTVHTTISKALVVPVEGRIGKTATPMSDPLRTMTTRSETGLAFIAELRGGGSKHRPVTDPLCTVVANGNHHGLVTTYYGNGGIKPASDALATVTAVERHALLMRNNTARGDQGQMTTPATEYVRAITTTGHQSLLTAERPTIDLDDVLFRMLEPREIAAAMDFPDSYRILGNRREQVRQAGNAVTPPSARDLVGVVAESLGVVS